MSKLVFALLSCFHGPQVEGSFNTMGDIIDPKSYRMQVHTYSAVQTVKYGLRATKKCAVEYFHRAEVLHDKLDTNLARNMQKSYKLYNAEQQKNREAQEAKRKAMNVAVVGKQSKQKAKAVMDAAEKKARMAHRKKQERLAKLRELVNKHKKSQQK